MAEQSGVLTQIARPCAAALFDLAKSEGSIDAVESGLTELQKQGGKRLVARDFLNGFPVAVGASFGVD